MDTRRKIREISDDLKRFTSSDPVCYLLILIFLYQFYMIYDIMPARLIYVI